MQVCSGCPGTPGRSVQPTLFDILLTWLLWHWVLELSWIEAELELWSRTARPKCSAQRPYSSTDSASRKKSSFIQHFSGHGSSFARQTAQQSYFAGSAATQDSPDVKGTAEFQVFFGTLAQRDAKQLDPVWSLLAAHVKARCLLKQFNGKPCQFRSAVKLGGPGHLCFA